MKGKDLYKKHKIDLYNLVLQRVALCSTAEHRITSRCNRFQTLSSIFVKKVSSHLFHQSYEPIKVKNKLLLQSRALKITPCKLLDLISIQEVQGGGAGCKRRKKLAAKKVIVMSVIAVNIFCTCFVQPYVLLCPVASFVFFNTLIGKIAKVSTFFCYLFSSQPIFKSTDCQS